MLHKLNTQQTYKFVMGYGLCMTTHVHEHKRESSACRHRPVLLWMVLTVVVVRGGELVLLLPAVTPPSSSSCEQPFSMART